LQAKELMERVHDEIPNRASQSEKVLHKEVNKKEVRFTNVVKPNLASPGKIKKFALLKDENHKTTFSPTVTNSSAKNTQMRLERNRKLSYKTPKTEFTKKHIKQAFNNLASQNSRKVKASLIKKGRVAQEFETKTQLIQQNRPIVHETESTHNGTNPLHQNNSVLNTYTEIQAQTGDNSSYNNQHNETGKNEIKHPTNMNSFEFNLNLKQFSLNAKVKSTFINLSINLPQYTFNSANLGEEIKAILMESGFESFKIRLKSKGKTVYSQAFKREKERIDVRL
jgi:phosphopantetheine adenylyltransferase